MFQQLHALLTIIMYIKFVLLCSVLQNMEKEGDGNSKIVSYIEIYLEFVEVYITYIHVYMCNRPKQVKTIQYVSIYSSTQQGYQAVLDIFYINV